MLRCKLFTHQSFCSISESLNTVKQANSDTVLYKFWPHWLPEMFQGSSGVHEPQVENCCSRLTSPFPLVPFPPQSTTIWFMVPKGNYIFAEINNDVQTAKFNEYFHYYFYYHPSVALHCSFSSWNSVLLLSYHSLYIFWPFLNLLCRLFCF